MTDGLGSVIYSYNTLSRMTQESRTFTGVGTLALTYTYNNAGLASITGPTQYGSPQVTYTVDHTGATTSVNGSGPTSAPVYAQSIQYRASGGLKSEAFGNGRSLSVTYDNRLRVKRWDVAGVMGWDYSYTDFGENTRRVTYAQNLYDSTLSRSYDYDAVGRLLNSYTGTEALAHTGRGGAWGVHDGPYSQAYIKDEWGNITRKMGRAGDTDQFTATYTNNRRDGFSYDSSGNLIFDGGQTFTYDATGQQATASYGGYSLTNSYDGDRLRVKKVENGVVTYYVRSSVMGGRVIVESNSAGGWYRGYVYDSGGGLIGIQANGAVTWAYEEPATKSQRMADASGNVTAAVDLDPWGLETSRSWNSQQQTYKYTTYERDGNQSDEATARRYNRWHLRFDEPDPYEGSYDLTDPQSFNRYAYVGGDPINFTDPTGLWWKIYETCSSVDGDRSCRVDGAIWIPESNIFDFISTRAVSPDREPQNTRGPCPKSAENIMGNRKIKAELIVAFGLSGHRTDTPIEQGGWVYQNRKGGLEFIRANPAERSTSGHIALSNPPSLPGAFLVATYHTHPYSEADANYMLTPTNRMGPTDVDENLAYRRGVLGLVIYENGPPENGKINLVITYVGPNRLGGDPDRAKPPADGFPGNSVDYRECP